MKKINYLFLAGLAGLASCANNEYLGEGENPENVQENNGAILFSTRGAQVTRGEYVGATAAEKLGKNFIVEGTKGLLPSTSTTTTPVFDNYLVTFNENTAGTTESNTNNWEYVDVKSSIHITPATLNGLRTVQNQTIKYWDYSVPQYDFVAYSTGSKQMVTTDPVSSGGQIKVTGIDATTKGYSFEGVKVEDLKEVYITDVVTVEQENYGKPVTLKFKNLTSKVRLALYETVPGYSVKDVKFYESDPTYSAATYTPVADGTTLTAGQHYFTSATGAGEFIEPDPAIHTSVAAGKYWSLDKAAVVLPTPIETATLYTPKDDQSSWLPRNGTINVTYPHTGLTYRDATPQPYDYNRAQVTVTVGTEKSQQQAFGTIIDKAAAQGSEEAGNHYLGRSAKDATFAGAKADDYYQAVIPNTTGHTLTLCVDYTLVSTDGSGESINVYGAKAVVPATYTIWQPNYAYTYIFKISDNTNGSTEHLSGTQGLYPITFDAVVAQVTDADAEQTTITTVATPSITTYQYNTDYKTNEYDKKSDKVYAMVMDNSNTTPSVVTLAGKSSLATADYVSLYHISKEKATEAEVMDALLKQYTVSTDGDITGRNKIVLTKDDSHIALVSSIDKGVDGNPVNVNGTATQAAAIDASALTANNYYAFVYVKTPETTGKKVYELAAPTNNTEAANYYEVTPTMVNGATAVSGTGIKAGAGKLYFRKNMKADGVTFDSWTFVPTTENVTDVDGYYVVDLPNSTATTYAADNYYIDIYTQYAAVYGVKVFKIK